jgi:uncharacterized protein (TIGR03435 family)
MTSSVARAGCLSIVVITSIAIAGQAARPSFEITSVKPSTIADAAGGFGFSPDGVTISNYSLRRLISNAYGVMDYQIIGGPSWISTDRFEVLGKAAPGSHPSRQDLSLMLQSLLEDRFKLQVRRDMKIGPVYSLVVTKSDGTLGEHLRRSPIDCQTAETSVRRDPEKCSMRYEFGGLHSRGMVLESMVMYVQSVVQRPIIDLTKLTGGFDYDLAYNQSGSADSTAPSIFSALQEQLGLKLVSEQGPVETLVIEHADHPTPN